MTPKRQVLAVGNGESKVPTWLTSQQGRDASSVKTQVLQEGDYRGPQTTQDQTFTFLDEACTLFYSLSYFFLSVLHIYLYTHITHTHVCGEVHVSELREAEPRCVPIATYPCLFLRTCKTTNLLCEAAA